MINSYSHNQFLRTYKLSDEGKEKITLELTRYDLLILRDSITQYSKLCREKGGMTFLIHQVIRKYLKIKTTERFNLGLEHHLEVIWDAHERYHQLLILLSKSESLEWTEKDKETLEGKLKYFLKTKLMYEEEDEHGHSLFSRTVDYVKGKSNFNERLLQREKIIALDNENSNEIHGVEKKDVSLMSKITSLF